MKRITTIILTLILLITCTSVCHANDDVKVLINNYPLEFDVPPQIIDGRTMVPMRKIFEAFGAKVDWIQDMQTVIAVYKTSIIAMPANEYSFSVTDVVTNETKTVTLDVPVQIIDGRTLVPARAISEAIGKKVDWDPSTRTVLIND